LGIFFKKKWTSINRRGIGPDGCGKIGPILVGRTVTVIFVGIVEAVFGAEEQAAYGKQDG
jgi:hypothetical protein